MVVIAVKVRTELMKKVSQVQDWVVFVNIKEKF